MSKVFIAALASALLCACSASAASIDVRGAPGESLRFVMVTGTIELGDDQRFAALTQGVGEAVVMLSSGGGSLAAGIGIGEIIRRRGYGTVVADGDTCASSCALAWLGGSLRMAGQTAKIGFHAGYSKGEEIPSGPANAVIGAYLAQLGLSRNAIVYVTREKPTSMQWFSFDDAREIGIDVKPLLPGNTMAGGRAGPAPPLREASLPPAAPMPAPPAMPPQPPQPPASAYAPALPSSPSASPGIALPADPLQPTLFGGLNLHLGADVRRLQQRLKELGFLTGTADGAWGARSRLALREFKRINGLAADDLLTQDAGALLFGPGSRRAPTGFSLPDSRVDMAGLFAVMPPPPGARLSPLNQGDALAIQSRLEALGFYRGAGDGTWGDGSRAALADFKVVAGLPPTDDWSAEVEQALLSPGAPSAGTALFGTWIPVGIACTPQTLRTGSAMTVGSRVAPDGRICAPRFQAAPGGYVEIVDACTRTAVTVKLIGAQLVRLNPNGTPDVFVRCAAR